MLRALESFGFALAFLATPVAANAQSVARGAQESSSLTQNPTSKTPNVVLDPGISCLLGNLWHVRRTAS